MCVSTLYICIPAINVNEIVSEGNISNPAAHNMTADTVLNVVICSR